MKNSVIILWLLLFPCLTFASDEESSIYSMSASECAKYARELFDNELYEQAFPYVRKAAESGVVDAHLMAGYMFSNGLGVAKNPKIAMREYKLGMEKGSSTCANNLGSMYYNGQGVDIDFDMAFKYYKYAADKGERYGYRNMGLCYEYGRGTDINYDKAIEYYNLAINASNNQEFKETTRTYLSRVKEKKMPKKENANTSNSNVNTNVVSPRKTLTSSSFFPIYGVTLGSSTAKNLEQMGHNVEYKSSGSKVCSISGCAFWDFDKDSVFEQIYITKYDKMPPKWKSLGMDWSLSYNEWMAFFKNNGFLVLVEDAPTIKYYDGRKTLSAEFKAKSKDGSIEFELGFDYGNHDGEGTSVNSKNSLYSIDVEVH